MTGSGRAIPEHGADGAVPHHWGGAGQRQLPLSSQILQQHYAEADGGRALEVHLATTHGPLYQCSLWPGIKCRCQQNWSLRPPVLLRRMRPAMLILATVWAAAGGDACAVGLGKQGQIACFWGAGGVAPWIMAGLLSRLPGPNRWLSAWLSGLDLPLLRDIESGDMNRGLGGMSISTSARVAENLSRMRSRR